MNPFLDIIKTDNQNNLERPYLISVGAQAGHGKSLVINTMVMNYIKSGINVILFCETYEHTTKVLFDYIYSLKLSEKKIGNLIICNLFFEDTIEAFNKIIAHHMKILNGSCAIVIDGPMFETQHHSFSYTKFKNENTRFVFVEKFNKNKELIYSTEKTENNYTRNQIISETLRNLSIRLNTHVIISTQHHRTMGYGKSDLLKTTNNSLAYASDLILLSQKDNKQNTFLINILKDRTGNSGTIKCVLDTETLSLRIIKNKFATN